MEQHADQNNTHPAILLSLLPGLATLTDTDNDVQAVVTGVEALSVTLRAVTNERESVVLEVLLELRERPVWRGKGRETAVSTCARGVNSCAALCSTSRVTTRVINKTTFAATDRPLDRFLSRGKMPSPVSTTRSTPSRHARCTAPVPRCLPTLEHANGACWHVIASEMRSGRKISSAGPRKTGRELTLV